MLKLLRPEAPELDDAQSVDPFVAQQKANQMQAKLTDKETAIGHLQAKVKSLERLSLQLAFPENEQNDQLRMEYVLQSHAKEVQVADSRRITEVKEMLRKYAGLAELKDMLWEIIKDAQKENELLKKQLKSGSAPAPAHAEGSPAGKQLFDQAVCLQVDKDLLSWELHELKSQINTHDKNHERLKKSNEVLKKQHADDQYIQMNYLQEVAHLQDKIVALQSASN